MTTRWGNDIVKDVVLGQFIDVFVPRLGSITEVARDVTNFSEREYLVQGTRRLTFGDHRRAVDVMATFLESRGVTSGDRVLLLGANSIEWVVSFWAIAQVGAVVVLGNAWWSGSELMHALALTRPTMVLTDERCAPKVPSRHSLVRLDELRRVLDDASLESKTNHEPAVVREDDPAVMLFTSGTTGMPKGVVLSHRGIIATLHATLERTRRLPSGTSPPPSSSLLSLPLFHVGGLQQLLPPFVAGGTLVFTEGRFDPASVVALIRREGIRVWSAVPTMVMRVLDYLEATDGDALTSMYTVGLGGAPVAESLRARVTRFFPNVERRLAVSYGLSEAGGIVTTGAGEEVRSRPDTVGRAFSTVELRIDNPNPSGTGEVLVRSPTLMLGYVRAVEPDLVIDSGPLDHERWLHTGDLGHLDDEGYLFVDDRLKDIVIRGGENIATPHVEDALLAHPAVRDVAVFGLPHEVLGEELAAVVVVKPTVTVRSDELRAYLAASLAYYEIPTAWHIGETPLPYGASGKSLKRELRDSWSEWTELIV
jgi:long-chain acyl-CoA synthetase